MTILFRVIRAYFCVELKSSTEGCCIQNSFNQLFQLLKNIKYVPEFPIFTTRRLA